MSIELNHISCSYPAGAQESVTVFDDFSLQIADGEFIGIMGHTGCGKTTLLQLMAGLIAPSGGEILINGEDINKAGYDRSILRRSVGIVFQYPEYQLFETTVEKDVAFGLKHSGLSRTEVRERVIWALTLMGFSYENIRTRSPLTLSGGEKRRVAIAGVLAAKPDILMFDEPIAGLDPQNRTAFLELAAQMNSQGTTVIIVSHNADALAESVSRLIVLDRGRAVMDGDPKSVFADPARMQELHLGVSTPRAIADMLAERGVLISPDIIRYEELLLYLQTKLGKEAY
jgi:energy-coupling factor transport system ATP-binding protein